VSLKEAPGHHPDTQKAPYFDYSQPLMKRQIRRGPKWRWSRLFPGFIRFSRNNHHIYHCVIPICTSPELCDSPDQAAHYHIFDLSFEGFIFDPKLGLLQSIVRRFIVF
jgi:hypothetical protein